MVQHNPIKCFLCNKPYHFVECPHKKALNVLRVIQGDKDYIGTGESNARIEDLPEIGALCFNGAFKKQYMGPTMEKGLIYIDI